METVQQKDSIKDKVEIAKKAVPVIAAIGGLAFSGTNAEAHSKSHDKRLSPKAAITRLHKSLERGGTAYALRGKVAAPSGIYETISTNQGDGHTTTAGIDDIYDNPILVPLKAHVSKPTMAALHKGDWKLAAWGEARDPDQPLNYIEGRKVLTPAPGSSSMQIVGIKYKMDADWGIDQFHYKPASARYANVVAQMQQNDELVGVPEQ